MATSVLQSSFEKNLVLPYSAKQMLMTRSQLTSFDTIRAQLLPGKHQTGCYFRDSLLYYILRLESLVFGLKYLVELS